MSQKRQSTKRRDGRLVKSISVDGKRIYFYGTTEREINKKIIEFSEKKEKGELFKSIAEDWWDEHCDTLGYQTRRGYVTAMNRAISEFDNVHIATIETKDVSDFLRNLALQGYSQKTVNNHKLVLNLIFKFAILKGIIKYNPCENAKIKKGLPKAKRSSASLNDEEIIKNNKDLWLVPYIALNTGLRKGELIGLKWKDIDFENNLIHVERSTYFKGNQTIEKSTKTEAGERIIPLIKPLKEELLKLPDRKRNHYVCTNSAKTLNSYHYEKLMKEYKEKTGMSCTLHQLRHSFTSICVEAGLPPKTIQEILGHAQISTTMDIYADFRKKSLDVAIDTLNKAIK